MNRLILFFLTFLVYNTIVAQNYFNNVYRFGGTGLGTLISSICKIENKLCVSGLQNIKIDSINYSTGGFFELLKQNGDTLKYVYLGNKNGKENNRNAYNNDMKTINDSIIYLNTFNNWSKLYTNITSFDKFGEEAKNFSLIYKDTNVWTQLPRQIIPINNSLYTITNKIEDKNKINQYNLIIKTDLDLNLIDTITLRQDGYTLGNYLSKNTDSSFCNLTSQTNYKWDDTSYYGQSLVRIIDTLGNTIWKYTTPKDRDVGYGKIYHLNNNNYLCIGNEEYARVNNFGKREVYDLKPIISILNKDKGIIKETHLDGYVMNINSAMLSDSGYIITGNRNYSDTCFIVKYDKNGNKVFSRKVFFSDFPNFYAEITCMLELDNKDLVFGGTIIGSNNGTPTYGNWGWLIRTDSMGCSLEPDSCMRVAVTDVPISPIDFTISPNPVNDWLKIQFGKPQKGFFIIHDMNGRLLSHYEMEVSNFEFNIDVSKMISGVYAITFRDTSGRISSKKLVLVNNN